jgi:phosphoribosylformylglycinamidine (FGAM) synthase PurS component
MALPKKFNETINFKNRVESLNDLTYYSIEYDYVLTGKKVEDFDVGTEITGLKEITALDEEQAKAKIENWFQVLIKNEVLESYKIKSTETKTFYETLKDKKILDLLKFKNPQ